MKEVSMQVRGCFLYESIDFKRKGLSDWMEAYSDSSAAKYKDDITYLFEQPYPSDPDYVAPDNSPNTQKP